MTDKTDKTQKEQTLSSLYLITKEETDSQKLIHQVDVLLTSGIKLVQYRQKNLNQNQALNQAQQLKKLCVNYGAKLIINDDIELACKINADGIHLGISDKPIEKAHQLLNQNHKNKTGFNKKIIGVSCYNQIDRVQKMLKNPLVDLISLGAVFPSQTKPKAKKVDFEFIANILKLKEQLKSEKKIYAIGGISHQNINQLKAIQINKKKLDGVCICADLFDQTDLTLSQRVKILFNHLK